MIKWSTTKNRLLCFIKNTFFLGGGGVRFSKMSGCKENGFSANSLVIAVEILAVSCEQYGMNDMNGMMMKEILAR